MKNLIYKGVLALVALTTMMTFTGCKDDDIAETLDGIWEGEVATSYFSYRWGEMVTEFQAVDIQFYADPFRFARGEGVEYDYTFINEHTGYCEYVRCGFWFEVRNGNIYIDYDDGTRVAIYDYRLNSHLFSGRFCDYHTGRTLAAFNFVKVMNWRHYGGRHYRERYPYSRSGEATDGEIIYKEIPSPALKNKKAN